MILLRKSLILKRIAIVIVVVIINNVETFKVNKVRQQTLRTKRNKDKIPSLPNPIRTLANAISGKYCSVRSTSDIISRSITTPNVAKITTQSLSRI